MPDTASAPSPYLANDPPTSSGRTLLALAFAHYCGLMWGYAPTEVACALSDEGDAAPKEHREIKLAAGLIGRIMADGRLRSYARPFGGGEPIPLKASIWEVDNFTARFAGSSIALSQPFDHGAPATHWIFVDTTDFDAILDAVTSDVPRPPHIAKPSSEPVAAEISATGHDRLLRLPEVMHRTGMSRSTIYARMGQGRFPSTVPMTGIAAWRESDVSEWLTGLH
jgi:predicted DNA-binding transcriptional regulator AlpA